MIDCSSHFSQNKIKKGYTSQPSYLFKSLLSLGITACSCAPTTVAALDMANPTTEQTYIVNHHSQGTEIEQLQKQLHEATRQLYEYKANMFRASHPHDIAKISEMSQKIREYEALNELVTESSSKLEAELEQARKQISALETSTDAMNHMLHQQRIASTNSEKFSSEQISSLKKQLEAANQHVDDEKMLVDKLGKQLTSVQTLLESSYKQYADLEAQHVEVLTNKNQLHSLLETHQDQLSSTKEQLKSALQSAELTKADLLYDINLSKRIIEQKIAYTDSLEKQLKETTDAHIAAQDKTKSLEQQLADAELYLDNAKTEFERNSEQIAMNHANLSEKMQQEASAYLDELTLSFNHVKLLENQLEEHGLISQAEILNLKNENETLKNDFQLRIQSILIGKEDYEQALLELQVEENNLKKQLQYMVELQEAEVERSQAILEEKEQLAHEYASIKNQLTSTEDLLAKTSEEYHTSTSQYQQQIEAFKQQMSEVDTHFASLKSDLERSLHSNKIDAEKIQTIEAELEQTALSITQIDNTAFVAHNLVANKELEILALKKSIEELEPKVQLGKVNEEKLQYMILLQEKEMERSESFLNENQQLSHEYESLKKQLLETQELLSKTSEDYNLTISQYQNQIEVFKQQMADTETHFASLKEDLERSLLANKIDSDKIQTIESELEQTLLSLSQVDNTAIVAHSLLITKDQELIALKEAIDDLHKKAESKEVAFKMQMANHQQENQQLVEQFQNEFNAALSFHELEKKQLHSLHQSDLKQASANIEHLNSISQEQYGLINKKNNEIQELSIALETILKQSKEDSEQQSNQIKELQNKLKDQDQMIVSRDQSLNSLQASHQSIQSNLEQSEKEKEELQSLHLNFSQEAESRIRAHQDYQQTLLEQLHALNNVHSDLEDKHEEATSTLQDKENDLKITLENLQSLKESNIALNERIAKAAEQQAKANEYIASLETSKEQITKELQLAADEHKQTSTEVTTALKTAEALTQHLKEENEKLQGKVSSAETLSCPLPNHENATHPSPHHHQQADFIKNSD